MSRKNSVKNSAQELLMAAMVKNVSEVMLNALPNFWRIAKDFVEGRFRRVMTISLGNAGLQNN